MTNYGEYQEDTASALSSLLSQGTLPTDPEAIRNALECRSILLDDARNRLILFGSGARHSSNALTGGPVRMLASALDRMPASREEYVSGGLSPLDALSIKQFDPTGHWWREAASNHLLATHQLAGAADRDSWLKDDGSLWYLVGDSASIVEAITVLDHDLAEAGLLHTGLTPGDVDQVRKDVSYLSKSAAWYTTNPGADYATTNGTRDMTPEGVLLISQPEDFSPAQRHLAATIKPLDGLTTEISDGHSTPRITAGEAHAFVATQANTLARFARAADHVPGATTAAAQFADLAQQVTDLKAEARLLTDVAPAPMRQHIIGQLQEIGSQGLRLEETNKLANLSPGELTDLVHASREACVQGARAIRLEGGREHSNLRRRDVSTQVGPTRLVHGTTLNRRLTDLINTNAVSPGLPPWTPQQSTQRAALRQTLDNTPTSRPPHYPSPRGRDGFGR